MFFFSVFSNDEPSHSAANFTERASRMHEHQARVHKLCENESRRLRLNAFRLLNSIILLKIVEIGVSSAFVKALPPNYIRVLIAIQTIRLSLVIFLLNVKCV